MLILIIIIIIITYRDILPRSIPVGEGHHDVEGSQGEHQVEH